MAWLHLWFVLWACPFIPTKKEENDNITVKSVVSSPIHQGWLFVTYALAETLILLTLF